MATGPSTVGGVYGVEGDEYSWMGGVRGVGGASDDDKYQYVKLVNTSSIMWATLRTDGLKPSFSQETNVMTFTAATIDGDKKTTKSVATLAGMDVRSR